LEKIKEKGEKKHSIKSWAFAPGREHLNGKKKVQERGRKKSPGLLTGLFFTKASREN